MSIGALAAYGFACAALGYGLASFMWQAKRSSEAVDLTTAYVAGYEAGRIIGKAEALEEHAKGSRP